MRRIILRFAIVIAAGGAATCNVSGSPSSPPSPPLPPPNHYVIVVDRSSSITATEQDAQWRVASQIIDELSHGDHLGLVVAHEAGPRGADKVVRQMPDARNRANPLAEEKTALAAAKESLRNAARSALSGDPRTRTDLLSSIRSAGEHYSDRAPHRRVLVILSDMLHCVRDGLCFETQSFEGVPDEWFDEQKANGNLPRLAEACVAVMGVQQETGRDSKVREFWMRFFREVGADLTRERYRYESVGAPWRECIELP